MLSRDNVYVKTAMGTLAIVSIALSAGFLVGGIATGFDVPPSVDPATEPQDRAALPPTSVDVYRFGDIDDSPAEYSDGTVVPNRTFPIERLNQTTGEWEVIGYVNVHGHRVKIDATDQFDISIGSTVRINPKT